MLFTIITLSLHHNNKQIEIMDLKKLYESTFEFTDQQIENVINLWEREEPQSFEDYTFYLQFGKSNKDAFATAVCEKYKN